MATNQQKWATATHDVLERLDIAAEYRALGLDVCGAEPNSKGWIEARSYGVEDRTPSAGIHVTNGDGIALGLYKDFRGQTLGFFDFAATVAGKFADWREARKHYAQKTGVTLPNCNEETLAESFDFHGEPTYGVKMQFCEGRPGVTPQAITDCGGIATVFPKKAPPEKANLLISFPMYGPDLLNAKPTAYHSACRNSKLKVRLFKGKEREEKYLPKHFTGDVGLMGLDGLKRLAEADVVNICEGMTDLLACQAVLGDWRKLDPENRRHVTLTLGGATTKPDPWLHHFVGKEVRLWFDVDAVGETAGLMWTNKLLPHTAKVRNVRLPAGPDGGKNDLRQWIVDGHTYVDMDEYARTTPYAQPTAEEAEVTQDEALLKNLGLIVIGEYEGRSMIEVYSESRKKSATITDVNKLTIPTLVQILGNEVVERWVYEGKECPPDKYDLRGIKMAIANVGGQRTFVGDEQFGAGVWEHEGQVVLVQHREIGILHDDGQIESSRIPFSGGRILDCGHTSGHWFDVDQLNKHMLAARDHKWCAGVINEAVKTFGQWQWRQQREAPYVITGLVMASWLQFLWTWRPAIFVTGDSNTGKTMLLQETLAHGIFAGLGMVIEKPTEAAITQQMRHHSKILFVDEFEKDSHRQKILETFRVSSRGGDKVRGTADHRGIRFRIKHLPWMGAVETGFGREADKTRFIILDLQRITAEKFEDFNPPSREQAAKLGQKLLAISLMWHKQTRSLVSQFRKFTLPGIHQRYIESFSLPIANITAAMGYGIDQAKGFVQEIMNGWDFAEQVQSDHVDFLCTLLTAQIRLRGGITSNVTTLLHEIGPDARAVLEQHGIKKLNRGEQEIFWFCSSVVGRELMRDTQYAGHNLQQYGKRFQGARVSRQRLGGMERFYGVEIPMDVVDSIFESHDDEPEFESEQAIA